MKNHCIKFVANFILLILVCLPLNSFAESGDSSLTLQASTDEFCPKGFVPIPSGLACVAADISYISTVDVPPATDCPAGFERPPGVRFCIAENMKLEIQNDVMLISGLTSRQCPPGFSRAVASTICTADNLVVDVVDNEVKLKTIYDSCPKGFYKPVGSRFCLAENFTLKTLPPPPVGQCPPGFIKPPGVHFCIASVLLYKDDTRRNDIIPPTGLCPEGWVKPDGMNFCQPTHLASNCGANCGSQELKDVHIRNTINDFVLTPCPANTVEIWWDMPKYDEEGLFVIGSIPTRTCVPENLKPQG